MISINRREAPSADPVDPDEDPEAPTFLMDDPVLAADWVYRGYYCKVYRDFTPRDYPIDDRERIVGMVDGEIIKLFSDEPLERNIEEMIEYVEAWVDDRVTGWFE